MNLEGKNVAVLGLGVEGLALCDFLFDKVGKLTVCDQNSRAGLITKAEPDIAEKIEKILNDPKIDKKLGASYLDNLSKFDIVFRSPGIYFLDPKLIKAKAKGTTISSQMKLFFELCPCQIVGVTGTKGKGTTASLIYEILMANLKSKVSDLKTKVYLAGNIGKPAIDLIPKLKKDDIVILELSNFQLADLDRSPCVAVVTNLGVDHLDYHQNVAEYLATKENIVRYQGENDLAILNFNSTFGQDFIKKTKSRKKYFAADNLYVDCAIIEDEENDVVVLEPQKKNVQICRSDEIELVGRHNLENIAAATLVADTLGVPAETITDTVKSFIGLPYRLQFVDEIDGIKYINDSFATNPSPTIAAIKSLREDKVLILGGSTKGADFTELAEEIVKKNVVATVLIGQEADRIKTALEKVNFRGLVVSGGDTMKEIVETARKKAKSGDVVIFSPACASFDMFKNYKVRGEEFKRAVLGLN